MQTNHASALRGLSIAVIIISAIAILGCIIGVIFVGVGGSYLANMSPDMWDYYLYDDYYYDYDYYGMDGSDMAAIMALLIAVGGVALSMAVLFTVPALIAGILGLRNYANPTKLNLVFGWSLAGAICAFLTGNIVSMVLLIIMCVFAHKDKELAAAQPVVIAAPVAAIPVTAAPQPVQPVQPVAPEAVHPTAPEAAQPAATETVVAEETITPTTTEEVIATENLEAK